MKKILMLISTIALMAIGCSIMAFSSIAAGSSFADATSVSVHTSYTDNISDAGNVDYFKFSIPADGSVYFNFRHENLLDQNEYWTMTLYDGNTSEVSYYSFNGTSTDVNTKSVGLPTGTYYIRIRGGNWGYWDYSKRFSEVNYSFVVKYSETAYWEKENNESYEASSIVNVNNLYTGSINDEGDVDYYKFTLSSPGNMCFNFKHENLLDQNEFWTITLYDGNTSEIAYYSFNGTDTDVNTLTIGLPTGTYYIRIRGGYWGYWDYSKRFSTVNYSFNVKYSESAYWEKENNESMMNGNNVSIENKYYGSINDDHDVDYYKFSLEKAMDLKMTMGIVNLNNADEYYSVAIFDDKTNELAYMSVPGNNESTGSNISLPAGTYYIRIRGGNWGYWDYSKRYTTSTYSFILTEVLGDVWGISDTQTTNSITLKWSAVQNATGYVLYQYNSSKKQYVYIATTSANTYKISNLKAGTVCSFKVKAYKKKDTGTIYSENDTFFTTATKPSSTTIESLKATNSGVSVKWNKVNGASGYEIVCSKSKKFKNKITVEGSKKCKQTLAGLLSGTTYYVKVRAYTSADGYRVYGAYSPAKKIVTKPAQVQYVYVTPGTQSTKFSWDKAEGASGYQIVYSKSKKFKNSKTVTVKGNKKLSKTVKGLSSGTAYYAKIRAYKTVGDNKLYGTYSNTRNFSTKPLIPTLKSVKAESGIMRVTWSKVKNAEGYVVEYSPYSDFSYGTHYVYVYENTSEKYIYNSSIYTGDKYYVRVSAFSESGSSRYWGDTSNVKSVVVK